MRILFMCVANSARSQMAEGLARASGVAGLEVFSAGSAPAQVRPEAIQVLEEVGVNIGGQRSKGLSSVPLDSMDLVISLCAEEVCPLLPPATQHFHWPLKDPARSSDVSDAVRLHRFRVARDEIAAKLQKLWSQFGLSPREDPP